MKTAMQELIDKVEHAISYNVEGCLVEKYTWTELSNDMYALLEKEKEQIYNDFKGGMNYANFSVPPNFNISLTYKSITFTL